MAEAAAKKPKHDDAAKAAATSGLSDEELADTVVKLEEVQDELEKLNEKASDEILKVEQKYNRERRPVFEKRGKILAKIQDFWPTVFTNHGELFSALTREDRDVLEFLRQVDVEDFPDIRSGHTISFTFAENPYFEDTVLKKTYKFSDEGTVKITGTNIRWKPGKDITIRAENGGETAKAGKKRELEELEQISFFKWFDVPETEQEAETAEDEIADLIREEVWPNPLRLYTQEDMEGALGDEEDGDEDGDEEEGEEDDEEGDDADLEGGEDEK